MTDAGPPRRITDRVVSINVTGYFVPLCVAPDAPVLIGMPGTDDLFVAVFSTEEKLVEMMEAFQIEYARIGRVTDGRELLDEMTAKNASGDRP